MIEQKELMTDQPNIITDNVVEGHHETTSIPRRTLQRTDVVLHQKIGIIMTEALFKILYVPDIITINEILDPIVLLVDHTDKVTHAILVLDTNKRRNFYKK